MDFDCRVLAGFDSFFLKGMWMCVTCARTHTQTHTHTHPHTHPPTHPRTHARTPARPPARTPARPPARPHARTHSLTHSLTLSLSPSVYTRSEARGPFGLFGVRMLTPEQLASKWLREADSCSITPNMWTWENWGAESNDPWGSIDICRNPRCIDFTWCRLSMLSSFSSMYTCIY